MSIECYYSDCKYHGENYGVEGPFCDEEDCRATDEEIKIFEEKRQQFLSETDS